MSKDKPKIDFIGIGVGKCGTTWVHRCLAAHPDICCEQPKETHFFAQNFYRGFQWYTKQFSHCSNEKVRGEFSPEYIYDEQALQRISEYYPDSKIIIVFRNPIERLRSLWRFNYMRGSHSEISFQTYIEKGREQPIQQGLYYKHITGVLRYFDKEQLHIILYEDIIDRPETVLNSLYSFLGVQNDYRPRFLNEKINTSDKTNVRFRIVNTSIFKVRRFFKQRPFLKQIVDTTRVLGVTKLVNALMRSNRRQKSVPLTHLDSHLDSQTKQKMWEFYKDDIQNLDDLLNSNIYEVWEKKFM